MKKKITLSNSRNKIIFLLSLLIVSSEVASLDLVTIGELTWVKCSSGQYGSDCSDGKTSKLKYDDADKACKSIADGFRLPTEAELRTLVKCSDGKEPTSATAGCATTKSPSIDTAKFPNTISNYYWTSANIFGGVNKVSFQHGGSATSSKSESNYIRCVRNKK